MSNEVKAISDGTFTLTETEVDNQLYFYRNDREVLGDVGRIPMDFYHSYIAHKMLSGGITEAVMNNICFETSTDGKVIRLTVSGIDETKTNTPEKTNKPKENQETLLNGEKIRENKPNFLKRMFNKIFG